MAPAQIMDIPQTPTKYTHKKFQGKQQRYAHKKFGTRMVQQNTAEAHVTKSPVITDNANQNVEQQTRIENKKTSGDIFRPYALPETIPRKRKHHEIQDVAEEQQLATHHMNFKRFAPEFTPNYHHFNFIQHMQQPYYRLHYEFNAQTFALILQKQQAALCMGEILKRQAKLNLCNSMGQ